VIQATLHFYSINFFYQVEIFWDPPKGEFTKYNLLIDHLDTASNKRNASGAKVIKLFTAVIYCGSMVIPSFCVIK
jgi:hypothetical protein